MAAVERDRVEGSARAAGPEPRRVLECSDLRKRFGELEAVRGVSFTIAERETYGLLGPNGAGKTTTISMVCGLLESVERLSGEGMVVLCTTTWSRDCFRCRAYGKESAMSTSQPSYDPQWANPPPGFGCACDVQGPGIARVAVSGELDVASAPQLVDALSEAAGGRVAVILDLSELTFMDASGLHAILTARARLAEADGRFVLFKGCRQVQRIFELTGVDSALEFVSAGDARGLAAIQSS